MMAAQSTGRGGADRLRAFELPLCHPVLQLLQPQPRPRHRPLPQPLLVGAAFVRVDDEDPLAGLSGADLLHARAWRRLLLRRGHTHGAVEPTLVLQLTEP